MLFIFVTLINYTIFPILIHCIGGKTADVFYKKLNVCASFQHSAFDEICQMNIISREKLLAFLKEHDDIFAQYSICSVLPTIAYFYWAINILQVFQFLFITKLLWSFSLCKHFKSPLLLSSSFLSLCKRFFNTDRLQSLFITVLLCLFAQLVACAFSVPKPLPSSSRLKYSRFDLFGEEGLNA